MSVVCCLPYVGCHTPPPPDATVVPGAEHLRVVADPGPITGERPPVKTVWARVDGAWRPAARVTQVAPGGAWHVDAERQVVHAGRVVATDALPDLRVAADGAAFVTRSPQPPTTDVWRIGPNGGLRQVTDDGRSDRPFPLPDGRLLWVSGAGGVAGFVLDGARLTNRPGEAFVPVPARPAKSRLEGDALVYDAGDATWTLDLRTGAAGRR